jgi:hypothetical protein
MLGLCLSSRTRSQAQRCAVSVKLALSVVWWCRTRTLAHAGSTDFLTYGKEKVHLLTVAAFGSGCVPLGRSGSTWLKDLLNLPGVAKIDREIITKKSGAGTCARSDLQRRLWLCAHVRLNHQGPCDNAELQLVYVCWPILQAQGRRLQ